MIRRVVRTAYLGEKLGDTRRWKTRRRWTESSAHGRARHSVRAVLVCQSTARRGLHALPTRRRTVIRTINPQPIVHSLAQPFANRIHQDIAGFFLQFVMVTKTVIEEIALPIHAMFSGNEPLPVLHRRCHSWIARKRDNRMQMIWHKQTQPTMPYESLVVKFHRGQHGIASVYAAQLVFPRRHAVDGDKEPTALEHPLRN